VKRKGDDQRDGESRSGLVGAQGTVFISKYIVLIVRWASAPHDCPLVQ
jgi:hypothetical protein